jgi:hypothetical protein
MPQGPSLIFDKSSLESLNIHEAALRDNFYMSTMTPLFLVECHTKTLLPLVDTMWQVAGLEGTPFKPKGEWNPFGRYQ